MIQRSEPTLMLVSGEHLSDFQNDLSSVLPWQQNQWLRLLDLANSNTLPHALLFSGVEGAGKTIFAKHFAAYLLCENQDRKKSLKAPCGSCKQCYLVQAETHPDYRFIQPEEGAASIKVDQVRLLVHFFAHSSLQGGRKIIIVSPAEAMNHNAANALLKTLEEPSSQSIIILLTNQAGLLLPTIRSRCQLAEFPVPELALAQRWLMSQNQSFSDLDVEQALWLANGAPFKAQQFLEAGALAEYRTMLDEMAELLKNEVLSSQLATRWNDDIAAIRLAWMLNWLEQLLKLKMNTNCSMLFHGKKMFGYLAEKCTEVQLFELYAASLEQYRLFLGSSNPNKVLAFEMLLHKWSDLMRKVI